MQLIRKIKAGDLHNLVSRSWKVCGNLLGTGFLTLQPFLKILNLWAPRGVCRIEIIIIMRSSATPPHYLFALIVWGIAVTEKFNNLVS
jgi:hypothetical protein